MIHLFVDINTIYFIKIINAIIIIYICIHINFFYLSFWQNIWWLIIYQLILKELNNHGEFNHFNYYLPTIFLFLGTQFLRNTLVLLLQTTKNILMEINLKMLLLKV